MADWIINFIEHHAYIGIALLMIAENVFPPIPSELIMPFAGFVAARGDLHPAGVVLVGVVGSVIGTLPWYLVARRIGQDRLSAWAGRHGRWLTVSPQDIDRAGAWFDRHGRAAVFWGRLVPAVRSVISAPAGFAGMPLVPFLLWSAAGALVWCTLLVACDFLLESQYESVARWVDPFSTAVLVVLVAAYLWRVVRTR